MNPDYTITEEAYANYPRQVAVAVSGTDVEISPTRAGKKARIALSITQTTALIVTSIAFGDGPAVLNAGQTLVANQTLSLGADTMKDAVQMIPQGAIHAIASGAGNVSILEIFAP
jgi:predicted phage tail protein